MLPTLRPQNPSPEPIPGIYLTCDQWCMYCRVTDRCLAFRSTNAAEINGVWDHAGEATGEDISDGLLFIQALADAEGRARRRRSRLSSLTIPSGNGRSSHSTIRSSVLVGAT